MGHLDYKVLLIEDEKADVELIEIHLNNLDLNITLDVVSHKKEFERYLDENSPHLILSDYKLYDFTGLEALDSIRQRGSDLPFILVSGYIGEEKAVAAMRQGATDYVLKDNLDRLEPAVKRELVQYRKNKNKEKILSDAKNRYEVLVNTIDGIVWESDAKTFEFLYVSNQSKEILGYDPSEWYEKKTFWQDHIHPADRDFAINYCHIQTKAGENHTFEYRMMASNGEYIWLRDYVTVIFEDGKPSKLRGIMLDISHEKETESKLDDTVKKLKERVKEQECLYKISSVDRQDLTIPEILAKAVHFIPDGFQYTDVAEASIEFDGNIYQTENFIENGQELTVVTSDVNSSSLTIKVVYTEEKPSLNVGPFFKEEKNLLTSIAENLALRINRKIVQSELIEKQEQLEKAYNLAKIGNWELDLETSVFEWSKKTKEIHEVPEDFEPTQEKLDKLYGVSEDWKKISRSLERLIENKESIDHEVKILTAKGNEKWVRVLGHPEIKDGKFERIYGTIQDIDKRKRAEVKLKRSERRFKSLIQDGLDLIAIIDRDGNYQYVASTRQRIDRMGWEPEEYQGKNAFSIFHEDDHKLLRDTIDSLEPYESKDVGPFRYKNKDGEWGWMESTITNLTENSEINGYVTNSRDVTERVEQERKLRDIVENSTNLFYRHDVNHLITYISPQSKEFLGCSPEEAKKRWTEFATGHPINEEGFQKTIKAIETGETQEPYELQLQKDDGNKIWVEVNEAPIVEGGKTVAIVGSLTDITERKEALDKLISTEQKLREIVEYSTNLFYKHDVNHQLQYISPQSYDFVGLSPKEAMKKWTDLLTDHPVNEVGFKHTMKAIETGKPQPPYELQFRHANGSVVWARVHEAPIVEDGKTVAMVGSLTNITEQKKYEEKLQELSQIAAKTTDIIFVADEDHRITWVNTAFEKSIGYTLDESAGKLPTELFYKPKSNKETLQRINRKMEAKETANETIQIETKSGEKKWTDITIDCIVDEEKNSTQFFTIMKDVTEKIEREKALQESLERYNIVTKATSDIIWDADLENDTVTYNSNIYDVFGYEEGDVVETGEWWITKIHPEDRERVSSEFKIAELQNRERIQCEYRFECADGSYRYMNDRAYIINDEDGKPVRMIGAMQDITKQKEENLWLKLLESAIANTTEAIAIIEEKSVKDSERKILYVNDAFESMTGFSKSDALGNSLLKFMGPQSDRNIIERAIQALDNGENYQMEISYTDKENELKWAHISFAAVKDKNGNYSHWICIGRNVTERRKRISQLKESLQEKETLLMEIHHRVKNNLAVVSSMMQLQAMEEQDESLQKKLYDSVARIRTMVTIHEMLYESGSFSKIDFSVNLQKLVSMITETIHNQKEIDVEFKCEMVELNVNQAIPSSLIVNEVVTNSIKHAFKNKKGGKITIRLREIDENIEIGVLDDGVGLPNEFEKLGGSSLGLQLIDVLAKQLDAEYTFNSSDDQGTEFLMHFEKTLIKGIGNAYLS